MSMMTVDQAVEFSQLQNYISPSRYISGRIIEYDIKSANITMLHMYGAIDDKYYKYLNSIPKYDREREIGNLIRVRSDYYEIIKQGIVEAKKNLFLSNDINIGDIVRIANDAVYINKDYELQNRQFSEVLFKKKSENTVMLVLPNIIFFFFTDRGFINLDIKGLSKDVQEKHSNYMISFIANIINTIEKVGIEEAAKVFNEFYDNYINLRLDKHFYMELNSRCMYCLKYTNFYVIDIDDINSIDISYNLYILRELYTIIISLYRRII